jgi:hypothetical protein
MCAMLYVRLRCHQPCLWRARVACARLSNTNAKMTQLYHACVCHALDRGFSWRQACVHCHMWRSPGAALHLGDHLCTGVMLPKTYVSVCILRVRHYRMNKTKNA